MSRTTLKSAAEAPIATRLGQLTRALVTLCWWHAPRVLLATALVTPLLAWFAASYLGIDTQTSRLLDPSLTWRQQEAAYNTAFPHAKRVLAVVLEGETPELASQAARALSAALLRAPGAFSSVSYLEGTDFFRKEGLLYLDLPALERVTAQLIAAQGLIGGLASDPTLHGLFAVLGQALDGVRGGTLKADSLARPLDGIAQVIEAHESGAPGILAWGPLLTGRPPALRETLQVIAVKPRLDFTSLAPGKHAREAVLRAWAALGPGLTQGVSLHFTGDVALGDDELLSVKNGIGLATALSLLGVLLILGLAVRSGKAILAILITLFVGLTASFAFAAATVHVLNLVSVAFVVMFIGIAVDFGIQFCVRFRDEQTRAGGPFRAMAQTGESLGGALFLAALTTAIGFLAFLPTAYRGVSELGIIAGAGMLIAFMLNVTLLPALLRYLTPRPESEPPHLFKGPGPDAWISRNRHAILAALGALALGAAALLPGLSFDFNPLNLKDPRADSVRMLGRLAEAGLSAPNSLQLLVSDRSALAPLTARLGAIPEVGHVLSIESFIPKDQERKLAVIADAAFLLTPSFSAPPMGSPPGPAETLRSLAATQEKLQALSAQPNAPPGFARLAAGLQRALAEGEAGLPGLAHALVAGLPERLAALPVLLEAEPITLDSLPDTLRRQWIAPDGRFRIEIRPKSPSNDSAALRRFVGAVRAIAPGAIGPAYFIEKSGEAVWSAFQHAFLYALLGVALILALVLRRAIDVALILGPLLFAALLTLAAARLLGVPINFANVIALPLLMGIGVAFNIYFVANWRRGQRAPLRSSTACAVFFSALATLTAVSSLAVSPHAGTASMGLLLALCLGFTLISALIVVPALLASLETRE